MVPIASWNSETCTPDSRPAKRHKASKAEWEAIVAHFEFATCVSCGMRHESLHHILPRSQGGDDVIANLAPMCGDGTRGCHGLLESHAPGWERVAAAVRQYVITDVARRTYQDEHAPGFSRRYPALPNTEPQFIEDFRTIYGGDDVEGHEAA